MDCKAEPVEFECDLSRCGSNIIESSTVYIRREERRYIATVTCVGTTLRSQLDYRFTFHSVY
jgi:hypothetical protein